jgi:hypothetical protein
MVLDGQLVIGFDERRLDDLLAGELSAEKVT